MTEYVERHYDYVYQRDILTAGTNLLGGQAMVAVDGDAPFVLRQRAIYGETDGGGSSHQANTLGVLTRFRDANDQYRSSDLMLASLDIPFAGYNGVFSPVRPQIIYPARSVIAADVQNPAANAFIQNFNLIYRGVKIFPRGSVLARQLPNAKVRLRPWSYSLNVTLPAVQLTPLRVPFRVNADSDFILRAIQVGTQSTPRYASVMMTLRDSTEKPYSNLPVPMDYLCGNASARVTSTFQGVQIGNWIPGLIFPEIYLIAAEQMYFDLIRNDTVGQAVANVLTFNFIGAKVMPA